MSGRLGSLAAVSGLLFALAGCGSSSTGTATSPPASDAGNTVTISAADYMFTPATMDLAAGKLYTVKLVNTGQAEHSVSTAGGDIVEAEMGATKTGTFTPTTSGRLQFFCKYHKDSKNMVGSFNVTGTSTGGSAPAAAPATSDAKPYPY